jgi:hypothetical protein
MFDIQTAHEMRLCGMNGYDIAREMGVSKSWAYKWFPVGRNHRRWTDAEVERLLLLRGKGRKIKHIAIKLKRGENEVRIKLWRLKNRVDR